MKLALYLFISLLLGVVLSQNTNILFHVYYPEHQLQKINTNANLYIRGDWDSWKTPSLMKHISQDHWTVNITMSATSHQCKVLIDDSTWQIGANVQFTSQSSSFQVNIFPFFYTTQGTIEIIDNIKGGKFLPKTTRSARLYLPPSFYENPYKPNNNFLIMHDGQNLFDPETAFMHQAWMCQNKVDPMIVNGEIEELVILGVDNSPDRMDELTYSYDSSVKAGGRADEYLDFVEQILIPTVVKHYNQTLKTNVKFANIYNRESLGILGSSLGGLVSCYTIWTRSERYSKAGCMSSSFWWNNEDFNNTILFKKLQNPDVSIYLDSGDQGESQDDKSETVRVLKHMQQLGFQLNQNLFYYLDKGASHNEYYWGRRFGIPMKALYGVTSKQQQQF